nr:hypothetical protein [Mucilaginibacter sp. X5P1]MBB6139954.1 hypothetical protein [Mucilaginibacter sp. X5P1]
MPHRAIALQIRQNLGCYIFTLLSLRTWPLRFCKNLLCLPRSRPPSFCLISPEAVLLTEPHLNGVALMNTIEE